MAMNQAEQVVCFRTPGGTTSGWKHHIRWQPWEEDASSGFLSMDIYSPDGNRQLLSSEPFGLNPLGLAHEKRWEKSSQC